MCKLLTVTKNMIKTESKLSHIIHTLRGYVFRYCGGNHDNLSMRFFASLQYTFLQVRPKECSRAFKVHQRALTVTRQPGVGSTEGRSTTIQSTSVQVRESTHSGSNLSLLYSFLLLVFPSGVATTDSPYISSKH